MALWVGGCGVVWAACVGTGKRKDHVLPCWLVCLRLVLPCAPPSAVASERALPMLSNVALLSPQVAADFWRSRVFVKTYRERRSWWGVYRAYFRVWAVHLLLFHALLAQVRCGASGVGGQGQGGLAVGFEAGWGDLGAGVARGLNDCVVAAVALSQAVVERAPAHWGGELWPFSLGAPSKLLSSLCWAASGVFTCEPLLHLCSGTATPASGCVVSCVAPAIVCIAVCRPLHLGTGAC